VVETPHTTGNALELQELQGQETINNIHSKGPKAGGIVEVRSCSRDHATDAIAGMNVANMIQDEEVQGHQVQIAPEAVPLVQTLESRRDTTGSRVREATPSASTDTLTDTPSEVGHYDELYDGLPTYIPYLTRTRESDSQSVRKPHASHPLDSNHIDALSQSHPPWVAQSSHATARANVTVSLPLPESKTSPWKSHIMCSLDRALSHQKSRLQRRMHNSTKVLLAKKAWTPLDLQVAASMIRVSEPSSTDGSVGKDGWDSESSTN
jgi:hypothetical protein